MVGVVEGDDGLTSGHMTSDLHGVLDGLGAGVEERRTLFVIAWRHLVELLGDRDVRLVGRDHEAGVRERLDLLLHCIDDPLVAVAHTRHGDAGPEVDELVAVGVDEDPVLPGHDVGRQAGRDARRHGREFALVQLARARPRDLGGEDTLLVDGAHEVSSAWSVVGSEAGVCRGLRSSRGRAGSQVVPSRASARRRAMAESASRTTRLASAAVMSAWS